MELRLEDRVAITLVDGIARVRLTRAERHNAIDMAMIHAARRAVRLLRRERTLRCVILSGDGPSFCAGIDIKSVLAGKSGMLGLYLRLWSLWRNDFQRWSLLWRDLPVPVIAAIHGNCFGGGIQLALGADIRVATPDARLSIMESKWGLIPDMGGSVLLRELLPLDVAKELVWTGRIVDGGEAQRLGLVTHVAADPLARAEALAAEILTRSPDAVAAGKFLLQRAWDTDARDALATERRWQRRLLLGANRRIAAQRARGEPDRPYRPRRIG